jgi:hypothetical protein
MHGRAQKMCKTNLKLNRYSSWSIVVGDEREFADSVDDWRKGTKKFGRYGPPLDSLLHLDDKQGEALFPDYLLELGVASGEGVVTSSGELLRLFARNREV